MNENENRNGLYRVLVFVIGLVGVCLVIFGGYNVFHTVQLKQWGMWQNSYYTVTIVVFSSFILVGLLVLFGANRLSHRLMPNTDDLEKKKLKDKKKAEERLKKQEEFDIRQQEIDKKRRGKREALADKRGERYEARQIQEAQKADKEIERAKRKLEKGYTNYKAVRVSDEPRVCFFIDTYIGPFLTAFLGFVMMVVPIPYSVHALKNLPPHADVFNSAYLRWFLIIVVIIFWIGFFLFFGTLGRLQFLEACCLFEYQGELFLSRVNPRLYKLQRGDDSVIEHVPYLKVFATLGKMEERREFREKIQMLFKSDEFKAEMLNYIQDPHYDSLLYTTELNTATNVDKSLRRFIYRQYVKQCR